MNRRLLWSFVLAVLLPLAQVAAAAHEVSHVKAAPASIHCDECAIAAAVSGGAAAASHAALPLADFAGAAPVFTALAPHPAARFTAFDSRAPPSSH